MTQWKKCETLDDVLQILYSNNQRDRYVGSRNGGLKCETNGHQTEPDIN